jgi:hypothetical protein
VKKVYSRSKGRPVKRTHGYPGVGQSSSVMLDQKIQRTSTESNVKSTSNMPPLILPLVPLQMCTDATNWKIWPMAKRSPATER